MDKQQTFNTWYFLAAIAGVLLLQYLFSTVQQVQPISYSEFQDQLKSGKIAEITVTETQISGTYKTPETNGVLYFVTRRVPEDIAALGASYGVKVTGGTDNTWLRDILSWIVPVALFFGLWMFVFRRIVEKQGLGGGFMTVGRSKAKVYVETDTKVTFADVAGVDEAKAELQEIVAFLKEPDRYGRLGARIPKGILLVGPPGTGKTLLARAVAGEANVPFFSISGSEFVELFVGVGAARVRDLFEQARAKAPAIIFIDELDALGRARSPFAMGGGNDEKEQTLNQLLAELDGFDPRKGLVLLAATNRPEILDPALLRAGRFDRQVLVDRPDRKGRVDILKVHLKKAKLGTDVDPEQISALTPGFSGADLANLVNEAALLATRRGGDSVSMQDFTMAIERIVAGLEKRNRLLNPLEREVVAYHEMGHALVAMTLPGSDKVHKVSIIPRGIGSLGYTIQRPTEDRYLMRRDELENKMAVLLGGRAAEKIVFGELSTGAADDLAKVTDIARSMVTRYGMVDTLGQVTFEEEQSRFLAGPGSPPVPVEKHYSEETAREIDHAVKSFIDEAFARAIKVLTERRPILERGAKLLLQKETLVEAELAALVAGAPDASNAAAK
ncbi:MAG TPA: ATP-dependent zinc metalloprotease FtsH [Hypericibacter adhaerens]|nr:ATP-dependent zinc metalloprotease FtsH [Hypericibacter adhaerens]HWA42486.1 ATP-dependent zinc metalloprotease FtsH [Hypericibacter adhaerens]